MSLLDSNRDKVDLQRNQNLRKPKDNTITDILENLSKTQQDI